MLLSEGPDSGFVPAAVDVPPLGPRGHCGLATISGSDSEDDIDLAALAGRSTTAAAEGQLALVTASNQQLPGRPQQGVDQVSSQWAPCAAQGLADSGLGSSLESQGMPPLLPPAQDAARMSLNDLVDYAEALPHPREADALGHDVVKSKDEKPSCWSTVWKSNLEEND